MKEKIHVQINHLCKEKAPKGIRLRQHLSSCSCRSMGNFYFFHYAYEYLKKGSCKQTPAEKADRFRQTKKDEAPSSRQRNQGFWKPLDTTLRTSRESRRTLSFLAGQIVPNLLPLLEKLPSPPTPIPGDNKPNIMIGDCCNNV